MPFIAIENLGHGLTFVGSQSRKVDKRLHAIVICSADNRARISVSGQNHRPLRAGDGAPQRGSIVAERGQWDRSRDYLHPSPFKTEDDVLPTRSIGPGSVNRNYGNVSTHHSILSVGLERRIGNM